MRAQRRVEVVHQPDIRRVVQALAFAQQRGLEHQLLDVLVPGFGQMHLLALLVDRIIPGPLLALLAREPRHELVDAHVDLGALLGRTRDDERRARLIDQDRIDLIDDRVGQRALHPILKPEGEIVAQVVETELVVGAVGDVAGIGRALLGRILGIADHAYCQAEEAIDRAHPIRIALREILIHGDDVDALAGQRVEVGGQGRHQRLALARAHLGDAALMQCDAADQLDVEVAQAQGTARGLAHHGEGFGQEPVERSTLLEPGAKFHGLLAQLLIVKPLQRALVCAGLPDQAGESFDEPLVAAPEYAGQRLEHDQSFEKNERSQGLEDSSPDAGALLYG